MGSDNFEHAVRRSTSSTLPFTASGTATSIARDDANIRRRLTLAGRSTPQLSTALCVDTFAGLVAGFVSAGPVCIMDKAITQNASGAATLMTSIRWVTTWEPFALMFRALESQLEKDDLL
jgi:tetrahydromethanopterin S-methyltransferase subunit F